MKSMTQSNDKRKAFGTATGAVVTSLIAGVIAVEGGYVNHPHDGGGETMYGITERVARDHGYMGDMRELPYALAFEIYTEEYVTAPRFDEIVSLSPAVGEELIDSGVNVGTRRAACWFQESLNNFNRAGRDYRDIRVDCQIGPKTLEAFKDLQRVRGERVACQLMVKALDGKQFTHYTRLAERSYRYESFYVGWVNHRIGNANCEGN